MTETKQAKEQRLNCLIVDDESMAVKGIVNLIKKVDFLEVSDTASSAIEAAAILEKGETDLMFLDINMPRLSGIEFLESLDKAPPTILTTAYSEYALDGFRLHVVDYLMKPISFDRFYEAALRAREMYSSQIQLKKINGDSKSEMYIRQGDSFHKIVCEDILYVEGMQNYLKLHFPDRTLVIRQTMSSLEEMLPKGLFFRSHRSFLVNISGIETISGGRIVINGKDLPISMQKRDELLNTIVYKNLINK